MIAFKINGLSYSVIRSIGSPKRNGMRNFDKRINEAIDTYRVMHAARVEAGRWSVVARRRQSSTVRLNLVRNNAELEFLSMRSCAPWMRRGGIS